MSSTAPPPQAGGPPHPPLPSPASSPGSPSIGLPTIGLVAISAAAVFWAGLSLGSQTAGSTDDERAAVRAFSQTYRIINDQYIGTPAPADLLEGAIRGMFDVLDDPNSGYMRADEFDAQLDDARGEFEGVGAVMATQDDAGEPCDAIGDDCGLRVLDVLPGAPAQDAGLLAGDVVTSVDGEPLEGSTVHDSVRLIRGPRGSEVALTLQRDGETLELVITRDTVVSEDVHSAVLAEGQVGYLGIDGFGVRTADRFAAALREHLDAGLDRLIVDVRDDPGGFVDATVEISSQFLEDGAVFWQQDASGRQSAIEVIGGGMAVDPELEVVVLINAGSASASEILAGALQDAGRARLVGERSFGKGTVQEWTQLPGENGGFRLSVAQWLTRDKSPIDGAGLLPDVTVADAGERYRASVVGADPDRDLQLQAAIALLLDQPLTSATAGQGRPVSRAPGASPAPSASRAPRPSVSTQ